MVKHTNTSETIHSYVVPVPLKLGIGFALKTVPLVVLGLLEPSNVLDPFSWVLLDPEYASVGCNSIERYRQ